MCTISINQPSIVVSGTTITSVTVTGTIGPIGQCACDVLQIAISCLHGTFSNPQTIPIIWSSGNGTFSATFTGNDIAKCLCDNEILIRVTCNDGVFLSKSFRIDCNDCNQLNVVSLPADVCVNNAFQFQIAYLGGGTTNVTIDYDDGTVINIPGVGGSLVLVPPHTYTTTGIYTITIAFNGVKCQYRITVKACDCCPNATALVTSVVDEKCNKDLTKSVKVDALITPTPQPGCPTSVQADMYIDNIWVNSGSGSVPFTISHSGDFNCGEHQITIKYPGSDCPDSGGTFCVSVCETPRCKKRRFSFEVAATVSLISLLLYIFNSTYTLLAGLFTAFLIVAIINYIRWRPCDQQCKKCPRILAIWQIALATFVGFLMLSKSSFINIYGWLVAAFAFAGAFAPVLAILVIIIIILIIILIIYLLYQNWVAKCCPTECEKWTNIKEAFLDICAIAFAIVGGMILGWYGAGVAGLFWLPYATIIWALIAWWVKLKKINACGI